MALEDYDFEEGCKEAIRQAYNCGYVEKTFSHDDIDNMSYELLRFYFDEEAASQAPIGEAVDIMFKELKTL